MEKIIQSKVKLSPLIIGDLEFSIPIVQGGMGIKISTSSLVSAVSNAGAMGTLSGLALGYNGSKNPNDYEKESIIGLETEIRKTRALTKNPFGVNILVAASNYKDLVITSSKENVDFIVSGAGLPLKLPEYVDNKHIKLIPIVSSSRALKLISQKWFQKYNRLPDAVIVEGPLAGGHLGYSLTDILNKNTQSLEEISLDVIKLVSEIENRYNKQIPVIPAGGIFDGKDIARYLNLGAKGVQIATRFVVTKECSVSDTVKELYTKSKATDIEYIQSPVGMPGRVIKTKLSSLINAGKNKSFICNYKCLKTCNPRTAKFCIAESLFSAFKGMLDESIVFAGTSVSKINKMTTVKNLLSELIEETMINLKMVYKESNNFVLKC